MKDFFSEDCGPELLDTTLEPKYLQELIVLTEAYIADMQKNSDLQKAGAINILNNALNSLRGAMDNDEDISLNYVDTLFANSVSDLTTSVQDRAEVGTEAAAYATLEEADSQEIVAQSDFKKNFSLLLATQEDRKDDFLALQKKFTQEFFDGPIHKILHNAKYHDDPTAKDRTAAWLLNASDEQGRSLAERESRGSLAYPLQRDVHKQTTVKIMDCIAFLYDIDLEQTAGYKRIGAQLKKIRKSQGLDDHITRS